MRNALFGIMLGALVSLPGCAGQPPGPDPRGEISGRVNDAETDAALDGVAVVARWMTELPPNPLMIPFGLIVGGHGGAERRVARVEETQTDKNGRFVIQAFGEEDQLYRGDITRAGPAIAFFKPGYEPASVNLDWVESGMEERYAVEDARAKRLKLYRYGKKPRQDPGFSVSGSKPPTPEEELLRSLRTYGNYLQSNISDADDMTAPADSRPRREVRKHQQHAMEIFGQEMRRVLSEYSGNEGSQERNKQ